MNFDSRCMDRVTTSVLRQNTIKLNNERHGDSYDLCDIIPRNVHNIR